MNVNRFLHAVLWKNTGRKLSCCADIGPQRKVPLLIEDCQNHCHEYSASTCGRHFCIITFYTDVNKSVFYVFGINGLYCQHMETKHYYKHIQLLSSLSCQKWSKYGHHFSVTAACFLGFNLKKRPMAASAAYVARTQFLLPTIVYALKCLARPVNWCWLPPS